MNHHHIEAMRQALEALEYEASRGNDDAYRIEREALRTAIAFEESRVAEAEKSNIKQVIHLYDEPPAAQRQWVGLTEKDFSAINQSALTKLQAATSAESILKEKNT
jgi:hypothetical protein